MPIRGNDPRPAYQQLADELRQAIAAGTYEPGDRLPSTRELSEAHGIAAMTVRNAIAVLEDERLVVARQGRGVFVNAPEPPAPPAGVPMGVVLERLDETMALLKSINERLDRETGRDVAVGAEPAATESPEASRAEGVEVGDTLDKAAQSLAVARAAIAAQGPGLAPGAHVDPHPAPEQAPDHGIGI